MATKPFFVPKKEVNLIDALNEELIDDVVGQSIDIYKVSLDDTNTNMYGEATDGGAKVFEKGFQVNCLILFNEPEVVEDELGPGVKGTIDLNFHRNSLSGSGFYPEVGDIVDWNEQYWEIDGVTAPQLIAGHQAFNHGIKATAHISRLSQVNLSERIR